MSSSEIEALTSKMPPTDDVCPICFDDFDVPCKTNCGHWFCSICILRYLKFSELLKHYKCPICECAIVKLIPEIQPGKEASKIIKEIQHYNPLRVGGWNFEKTLALLRRMKRRSQENLQETWIRLVVIMMRWIGKMLGHLYDRIGLNFFPNGARGIVLLFSMLGLILAIYLVIDHIWYQWRRWPARRRLEDLHMD